MPAGATPKFSKPNLTVTLSENDSPSSGVIKYTEADDEPGVISKALTEIEKRKIRKYFI